MTQSVLYEPIKAWLTAIGFRALITGIRKQNMVIPVNDLAPAPYKIPDLVGLDAHNHVGVVEVEKDKRMFFDALGRAGGPPFRPVLAKGGHENASFCVSLLGTILNHSLLRAVHCESISMIPSVPVK